MSSTMVFAAPDVPVRLSVPEFVSASVPVPEIVLVTVRTWPAEKLNWSVPLSVTVPVTIAPSF